MSPIVKLGTSAWVRSCAADDDALLKNVSCALSAAFLGSVFLAAPLGIVVSMCPVLGFFTAMVVGSAKARNVVVEPPEYRFGNTEIAGESLKLLGDIQQRFEWAEKEFAQVPTGIRWVEVEEPVRVLLWEAAEHAARMSALDQELGTLVWPNPGTPQAALLAQRKQERDDALAFLHRTQREADDLTREAANAVAAARLAMERTGSVHDLRIVAPTPERLAARAALDAARARLALLAEAWSELDETGAITAERVAADALDAASRPAGGLEAADRGDASSAPDPPSRRADG